MIEMRQGRVRHLLRRSTARSSRSTRPSSTNPALVNDDPQGDGWFFKLKLDDRPLPTLMDEACYKTDRLGLTAPELILP